MSFRRDREQKKQRQRLVATLALAGIILLIFIVIGSKPLVSTGYRVATPFWQLKHQFRDRLSVATEVATRSKKDLIAEIEQLELEAEANRIALLGAEVARRENEQFREALGYVWEDESWLVAGILVRPPQTPYDILVLDVGSDDGVIRGQLVFASSGVVLGVVEEVFPRQAVVLLLSTPQVKTTVVLEKAGIGVTATGRGGGAYQLNVPREIDVVVGDLVVLPGRQTEIIGTVQDIIFDPRDPYQTVLVSAPTNFYQERFVYVSDRTLADIPEIEAIVVDETPLPDDSTATDTIEVINANDIAPENNE
jgi:cell shape-determining protein MreC